ncbi:MAG: spore coat associated protein CotJA [Lachnospiraceae bacterium]|nr:spore coat associated protein CotJA [Lachnospiraceae bacterium]
MAYVPFQIWNKTYELDKALQVGTLFPCLDKPFMGRCVCK